MTGRFTDGAPLATRADFERAAEARTEILGAPASSPTAPPRTHAPTIRSGTPEERRALEAALTLVAQDLANVPRPAVLDGEAWRASCRGSQRGRCGRCWLCEWEQQTDRVARPSRDDARRARVGVDEWFEAWVAYVEDPHGAKSSLGIQLDRLSSGLSYGGSFVAREPSAIRAATLFVGVAAALQAAAHHARGENQAMPVESVLDGLRALIVGLPTRTKKRGVTRTPAPLDDVAARWSEASECEGGAVVTPRAVKQLVGRWRRLAAVELAARGLMHVRRGDEDAVERVKERLMEGKADR